MSGNSALAFVRCLRVRARVIKSLQRARLESAGESWDHWGFHPMEFDATLGFQGEGPLQRAEKLIIGPVKEKERGKDFRVQVQPGTLRRYQVKYDRWLAWLHAESLPEAAIITRFGALD
eukprot:2776690-Amphidinium_carterae.1